MNRRRRRLGEVWGLEAEYCEEKGTEKILNNRFLPSPASDQLFGHFRLIFVKRGTEIQ